MQAAIPVREITNSPVVNNEFADLETSRVLFMAMDGITDAEKYELPYKAFGGMYMPHIAGLRESRYMLYRCKFTQLPSFTPVGDWEMMVAPEQRQHLSRSFTQTINVDGKEVQKVVTGFLESDANYIKENGEFKQKRSSHLLFHKRFPGNDVRKATQRSVPNGVGGVVELTALKGADAATIDQAQRFFFPNWTEIAKGYDALPTTVQGMLDHIESRIKAIDTVEDNELRKMYRSIGQDMLRSVNEFQRHSLNVVKSDEVAFKVAFEKGHTEVRNSDISEILLSQTGTRRKTDLLAGDDSAVSRLASIIEKRESGGDEIARKSLELQERQLFLEEVKLGIRNPDGTLKTEAKAVETVTTVEIPVETAEEEPIVESVSAEIAEPNYNIGDKLMLDSGEAEVIGKPFGRTKVRLADGTETMLDKV